MMRTDMATSPLLVSVPSAHGPAQPGPFGPADRKTGAAVRSADEPLRQAAPQRGSASADEPAVRLPAVWNRALQFRIDPATHQVILAVIDQDTGELVRQIPPAVQLALAAYVHSLADARVNRTL